MLRHFTFPAFAGTMLFVGSTAMAADARPTLESLDTNKDGQISLNEASVNDDLFVAFKKLDANRDGMLTKAEFAAWTGGR